jgi:hypothetical protein
MEMKNYHELVPKMDILRAATRKGSMKIFEDKKARYIGAISKEMWRCAGIGKNEIHYQTTISDSITKKAFELALEEFKSEGYNVSYNLESNLGVSVTISWPLDL